VAEEFVDLYEVLELPVDADRNVLRKRINELYLEAQRNLDHRTFATRIRYQQLFEVTMPQARYILLDDGRRDEYDRLVHAYRAATHGTPIPDAAPKTAAPKVEEHVDASLPGESQVKVEPLPPVEVDPEQLAREREELWKKWKSGLEEALTVDETKPVKARSATTASPTAFSLQPETQAPTPPPSIQASIQPAPVATPVATPAAAPTPTPAPTPAPAAKPAARPKVDISFDFEQKAETAPAGAASGWTDTGTSDMELSEAEIEARRTEHRRRVMKELLVNVGLIWGSIGGLLVFIPGCALLVHLIGRYYPRNAKPLLQYNPNILWGIGAVIILTATYFASRELSKLMRRKRATEFALLSYEELMKKAKH
jgi:hypothetical protein